MSELRLKIEGMHCGACVRRVGAALGAVEGVKVDEVRVGAARVEGDAAVTEKLLAAVNALGFKAEIEE